MRASAVMTVFLSSALSGQVLPGEAAPEDKPVVISDGQRLPSPLNMVAGAGLCEVGKAASLALYVTNQSAKLPVRMPFHPMITREPLLRIRITNEDGAEAVTYLGEGGPPFDLEGFPPQYPVVLTILPWQMQWWRSPDFVLWERGEYAYRMELRNDLSKQEGWDQAKGSPAPSRASVPIPNVWVGRVVFEGRLEVEEGPSEELKKELERLRDEVLGFPRSLPDCTAALDALVAMRHMHATDTLVGIEQELRLNWPNSILHPFAVKALYDITYHGTGYRALRAFVDIARDTSVRPLARLLAVEVLLTFEKSKDLRHKGRVFHVVGAGEREIAEKALRKLRATPDLPAEVAAALSALPRMEPR